MELFETFDILTIFPVSLNHYLVNLGTEVNVVDIAGTQRILQHAVNTADGNFHRFGFFTVDVDVKVRRLCRIRGIGIHNIRILINQHQNIV